jgi:hypothetical protein
MKIFYIFLLVATLAAMPVARAADIIGVITRKGTPPAENDSSPLMDTAD